MPETNRYDPTVPKLRSDGEETAKESVDQYGSAFVNNGPGYFEKITPADPTLGGLSKGPCDYILVDTDAATVTVQGAENDPESHVSPPLAKDVWHRMRVSQITAISAGNVWAGWIRRPPGLT